MSAIIYTLWKTNRRQRNESVIKMIILQLKKGTKNNTRKWNKNKLIKMVTYKQPLASEKWNIINKVLKREIHKIKQFQTKNWHLLARTSVDIVRCLLLLQASPAAQGLYPARAGDAWTAASFSRRFYVCSLYPWCFSSNANEMAAGVL